MLEYLETIKRTKLMDPTNPRNVDRVRKLNGLLIHPDDRIDVRDAMDPSPFYHPQLFLCVFFDVDSSFSHFCPACEATDVASWGWSNFRRILGIDASHYAVTLRYS